MVAKDRPIKLSFSLGFQIRYCLTIAAIFILANVLLYLLLDRALGGGYLESLRTLYHLDQHLSLYLSIMALLLTLFILVLTLVVTLLVSHRLAGPVFRYEDVLQKMVSGVFPRQVATRQTDQLKTLVHSLNDLTGYCRDTFEAAQKISEMLEKQQSHDADGENLEQLSAQVEKLRQQLETGSIQRATR